MFLVVVAGLAYKGWQQTDDMADFAIAGETLGPYVLGAAFAATFFSAATFVGYVAWSYDFGYANIWIFLALLFASPLALVLFAKRVREINIGMGAVSLPDWIGAYYNSQIMRVGVAIAVLFNFFYVGAQLTAGAQIFKVLLGWNYEIGLAFIVTLVTLYVLAGASYADIYTDAVQAILMAILGIVVFVSGFWTLDANGLQLFGHMTDQLAQQDPELVQPVNENSIIYYSGIAIFAVFFLEFAFSAQPQLFNKVLALDDPENLRKMIGTYLVLTVAFLLVIFGGFYLRVLNPGVEAADQSIFLYVEQYFPPLVAAFLGLVILSAALSTTDGLYIVVSTAIANDIFLKFLVAEDYVEMDDERAEQVSHYIFQATVLLTGIIGYLLVLDPPAYIGELIWVGIGGVAAATVAPVLFGIYLPNFVTRKAAISSLVFGVSGYLLISQLLDIRSIFVQGSAAVVVSMVIMLAVSAVTEQEPGVAGNNVASSATTGPTTEATAQPIDD
jgi:sodium/proline symporter